MILLNLSLLIKAIYIYYNSAERKKSINTNGSTPTIVAQQGTGASLPTTDMANILLNTSVNTSTVSLPQYVTIDHSSKTISPYFTSIEI